MVQVTQLELRRAQRQLIVEFDDGSRFELPCHYLRTHSPSAEVRGHGLAEPKLLADKDLVMITRIEPVGNYAVVLHFDDGHDTGIYSWSYLYELGLKQSENTARYQQRLSEAAAGNKDTD